MEPNPTTPARKLTRENDTCYHCQKIGHWALNCPEKYPDKFHPATPSPERAIIQLLRCNCGSACRVLTSRTDDNPDRKFYTCSTKKCKFFKWCDEVKWDAPVCSCRAGKCSINTDRGRRWYFACRVKKGLGACSFIQWVDSYVQDNLTVTNAEASIEKRSNLMEIDLLVTANQNCPNLADDQELGPEALMSGYVMSRKFDEISTTRSQLESEESSEMELEDGNLSPDCKLSILEEDELSPEDIDKLDYLTTSRISFRPSELDTCDRQREFVNRIDAAGDELAEDGKHLLPRRSRLRTAAADQAPEQNYVSILKKASLDIQQGFVSRLESNNIDPRVLEEEATKCFSALENIRLDHQEFKSNVTQYIDSLSKLSTMDADPTFQDLVNRQSREKRKFEELCSIQKEKTCKYKAYGDKIEELKEMMKKLKQEVEQCEADYKETEQCLVEINEKVKRAKGSMEMVDREVEEVRRQREVERAAAIAALDEAREALMEQ